VTGRGRASAWLVSSLIGVTAALGLTGCAQQQPQLGALAGQQLTDDVTGVRAAANSGSAAELAQAAEKLRVDVQQQQAAGALVDERAAAILDQLDRVLSDVPAPAQTSASATPTATSPSTSVTVFAPTTAPGGKKDKGADKGKAKG
jgi:hypothetical protein